MIKNVKRIFALMLAVAVIAMSMFTGVVVSASTAGEVDLLEFGDYLVEAGSTSKYFDTVLADEGETGDSWENAIIIDSAEEFVYLAKGSGDDTKDKYYKVADGIAGFDLSSGNLDYEGTLADNIDAVKASGKNHAGGNPGFQGNFDGNGVTVYGAWTNHNDGFVGTYAGLFTCTKGNVTVKNVHVKFASFTAKNAAGGIIGYHTADEMATVTIENCSVTDSHLEVLTSGWGTGLGAIIGWGNSAPSWKEADKGIDNNGDGDMTDTVYVNVNYNIKNCYVNLDEEYFISVGEDGVESTNERVVHGGVAGGLGSNALHVSDSVVIGIKPYGTSESTAFNDVQHSGLPTHFNNVYTTDDVATTDVVIGGTGAVAAPQSYEGLIFALSDSELQGAAALDSLKLDWSVWMADQNGYPELRVFHKDVAFEDNGDGTHGEVCACGFGGVSSEHIWVDMQCACGAVLDCSGRDTIYWDGSIADGIATGSGTQDNPYVIKTAAEFAWLIQNSTAPDTTGKYYKIDDAIGTIVLQPQDFAADILALETADDVQAFFEDISYVFNKWPNKGWEQGGFAGVFDGNGATVYGLYQVSANNAGLFSNIDAGAVIKNIALKNSYLTSEATNYQVGGLAAVTNGSSYGLANDGIVWFDSCVVANNYMYNASTSHDRSGVIIGASGDGVYVDNCLVYGNNATYGDGVAMPIVSNAKNNISASGNAIIPEGLEMVVDANNNNNLYYNMVRNSVIFGATPYDHAQGVGSRFNDPKCFVNVLTDAEASTFFSNVTADQIKTVSEAGLASATLGDAWLNTTSYPELKVFHDDVLTVVANGDGTHSAKCSCDFASTSACTFVDGSCSVCGDGLTCATKRTIYWDGSIATAFADTSAGTKDDPIIISTASELALLVISKADTTEGKYFEIAEDIGTIVLQSEDWGDAILSLESAAEVQALFEDIFSIFTEWPERGWEQACFAGNFNGNGVKIYGLYQVSDTNAGLFSTVDAGAAIRNVSVLNSYIVGQSAAASAGVHQYQVAAIACVASSDAYGAMSKGMIWLDGCTVGNCYMRSDVTSYERSGVLYGAATGDSVTIDNCLVYGNDAYYGPNYENKMPLVGAVNNSILASGKIDADLDVKIQENADKDGNSMYYNAIRNTISLGTDIVNTNVGIGWRKNDNACFENCYTDGVSGTVTFTNGEWTYTDAEIKSVTLETLNDNDLGDAWVKTDSYPELIASHVVDAYDNGDGTHTISCACGVVVGATDDHSFENGECICGAIEEASVNYGDVNNDGTINGRDYGMLMQYLNDYEVAINLDNADVNGDGNINGRDYGLLMQYLNDYDIVFG